MMTNNTWETNLILTLNFLMPELNRYLSIGILLFGTIGNVLNCLTLSQRALRTNPCSFLFLASSVASLITLISGVAVRLLNGWSLDLTDTVSWLCKIRIFVLYTVRTIASWLIMLATYDRWLSSSQNVRRRQMSTLKNSRRGVCLVILVCCLAYTQIFYCNEANLTNSPLKCYGQTTWCRLLSDTEFALFSIIIPSTLMFSFGLLTILNLRRAALRRIQPMVTINTVAVFTSAETSRRKKRTDHYLLIMLSTQVILLTLFSLPQAIQSLYLNSTRFQIRTQLQTTINTFVLNLSFLLTYIANGMPFYVYTLTGGDIFRRALIQAIQDLFKKTKCY